MSAAMKVKLKPFPVPEKVYLDLSDDDPTAIGFDIEDVDIDTLDELAEEWLGALYALKKCRSSFRLIERVMSA